MALGMGTTSRREPELDQIAHDIDMKFYWDLSPELRAETLKVKELRKHTSILTRIEEQLKTAG